jgi:energy-coupling factor transporter ATP-binding protein EcfA2
MILTIVSNQPEIFVAMSRSTSKSPFAEALTGLLDNTQLFQRREWASLLGIKESAISQWLSEETIPKATNLNMVFVTVERASDADKGPLETFRQMATLPALEASPRNGKRMLPTVWEYMKRPVFDQLSSELAKLTPAEQEQLLEERFLAHNDSDAEIPVESQQKVAISTHPSGFRVRERFKPSRSRLETLECRQVLSADLEVSTSTPLEVNQQLSVARDDYIAPRFRRVADGDPDLYDNGVRWEDIARTARHVLITGPPGIGKSSFLAHFRRLVQDRSSEVVGEWAYRLPILVSLHSEYWGYTAEGLHKVVLPMLPSGVSFDRMILLLDGFDEIHPDLRANAAQAVSGLRDRNPGICIIVTSRPTPDTRRFDGMVQLSMQPPPVSKLLNWTYKRASTAVYPSGTSSEESLFRLSSSFRERPDIFNAIGNPLLLEHAVRLFINRSMTALDDAALLEECLNYLSDWRGADKTGFWPRSRTNTLARWLGMLSFCSLTEQAKSFTVDQIKKWFDEYPESAPDESDLRAAAETTGLIEPRSGLAWGFAQETYQEYLAARFLAGNSQAITSLKRSEQPWVGRVLKFACSIASDATPLLTFVLRRQWANPAVQMSTLADMLAQRLTAKGEILDKACEALVVLLEQSFDSWSIVASKDVGGFLPTWQMVARKAYARRSVARQSPELLLRTVQGVHRARLSPAKDKLLTRLNTSGNEVVRSLGNSLTIDGYLQCRTVSPERADIFIAEVCESVI